MAPIGTQAESRSLQHVACNSPDFMLVVWLSETSNTLNKRINCFWFLRINLFFGSSPKVKVKWIEIRTAGQMISVLLVNWYLLGSMFERLCWSYSIKLEFEITAEYFPCVVRLDEECSAIFRREATRFSVTRLLTSSIPASVLIIIFLFVKVGAIDPLCWKCLRTLTNWLRLYKCTWRKVDLSW